MSTPDDTSDERRLAAQYAVTRVLAEAPTLLDATPKLLEAICGSLGWETGALWGVDRSANLLRCVATWHVPGVESCAFDALTRERTFVPGEGLPGRVLLGRAPAWIPDVTVDPNFPRGLIAATEGLRAAVGVPVMLGGEVLGVLEFFARDVRQPDEALLHLLGGIGGQIGLFIGRKRAEEERERLLAREQAARAEAEAASRAKDEFLALVSHELRTPLSAMLLWLRMLRAKKLDPSAIADAIAKIERSAQAQAKLIEDLLDVSRIITGKLRLHVRPVRLEAVIQAAVDAVAPAAEAKGIALATSFDASVPPLSGDPDRLQQVVWNLLSNAIKFTPQGGRVEVHLERAAPHARLSVVDTGAGIEPSLLPHVFDRFRQGETRTSGGLGLGLALVRHLVEAHGGTVGARSEGAGRGATFVVDLPIPAVHVGPPDARLALPAPAAPALDGVRVLVVDDERDARDVMTTVLESHNAEVVAAASAEEALAALADATPDVLVCDIGMPGEDGYALIRKIRGRETEHGGRLPAAALTAYTRFEDRTRALLAGFQIHLPKPIEPDELVAVVANLAGWTRGHPRSAPRGVAAGRSS
jgi:signal transduction histidine kinase/CheY-like chemotaxis protein